MGAALDGEKPFAFLLRSRRMGVLRALATPDSSAPLTGLSVLTCTDTQVPALSLPPVERSATPSNIKLCKHIKGPNPPSDQIRKLIGFIIWRRLNRLALKVRREIPERNGIPILW